MENKVDTKFGQFTINRYPKTEDKSLRAWSNSELLILDTIPNIENKNIAIYNDRFGFFNTVLNRFPTTTVWSYASQKKAITQNLKANQLSEKTTYKTALDTISDIDIALLKVPKSLELFELYLQQIHKSNNNTIEVYCGFMTKYFSKSIITIAEKYFEIVAQSLAWKKARVLTLKQPKNIDSYKTLTKEIQWKESTLTQYYGVFSSDKIDIGTQFFLKNSSLKENEIEVLDLASGNGIIGYELQKRNPNIQLTLVDDFNLAIASSKRNLSNNSHFVCDDNLDNISKSSFDVIVSNPPFHFEHENNIEVSLHLFKQVYDCLKPSGRFLLVANSHLNYKTHLSQYFDTVNTIANNQKFVVYECLK